MSFTISKFKCPDCDNEMYVSRRKGKQREDGHIKDIWCPYCGEVKKMVEDKNYI
jgi:predicted RNA-binding Zn-ribbon protein involved in translation (DUF1610 family)